MARIAAATERKLLDAVEKTAQLVEDQDVSPNEALLKVARDMNLRQGEITVVARAYNTGKANAIRETGESLVEKSAEFVTADAAQVISEIFPPAVKTAYVKAPVDDALYSIDYVWAPETLLPSRHKSANVTLDLDMLGTNVPTPQQDPRLVAEYKHKQAAHLFKSFEHWRLKTAQSLELQMEAVAQLAEYFDAPGAIPFASVKRAAAVYGHSSDQLILDAACEAIPRIKTAKHNQAANVNVPRTSPVFAKVAAVREATSNRQYTEGTYLNMLSVAADLTSASHDYSSSAIPIALEKSAVGTLSMIGAYELLHGRASKLNADMADVDDKDATQAAVSAIGSPGHEQKLRQIAVKANLQRLLTSDPVLRGYSPTEVADAFNQYAQLSPRSVDRDLPVRMGLRKQLSQDGLDTFDQQQFVDLDKGLAGIPNAKKDVK